ncbi:MAG: 1,3-beta-galactosyl-N-acetylhexosamine phosphorylase [Faecalicatena sp.]|uniref:1,3-beta-galactosyl-N-acetylhexosamine phosphorylase n=1 Tax=Faecalicatena sp. TaxID=2005360 RepID=UPI00258FB727|nr:1,3-beta-galactosyl-N-acetylhexosamine phosphorylase [Faecalicatena sp.]MCI6466431.1 1,3-beta-galactosyl-N-acetylhexosamine phosphorylase [Faecalicatena sp.]MDY5618393.1 1,3-beta-galactosyl-N-acetylhexosamine phosphorylase [Lachnospiraceae bacterium]
MESNLSFGRVTIPTDVDVVPQTKEILKRWGADAIRDCDGTDFPEELRDVNAKVYSTYYTTRKDNAWAKANMDEVQQMYIMTDFHTACEETLKIHLMDHLYPDMLAVNTHDDIKRWWEVIDRTTGQVVPYGEWTYDEESGDVIIHPADLFHDYTVSFLTYIMWDPVHMYNAVTNGWKDVEKQITFDVRQPKTKAYSMQRLRRYLEDNPHVDVIRYTTFFHQFTLIFDELAREKYVDWYGYSASVSPYILEQFEQEVGYKFRPEFIIDQGYMNNTYRIPSKEFQDFQSFQRREVAKLAKEMVDITHEYGKEAMMFLGDHWIGMEPFMDEFKSIGLDAVVGSVGNGATLRLISDIKGVDYTEGRFLPYFFPDVFHEGGDPVKEAKFNWVTARRAILRSPIDRIGYGGYLKLALQFPEFIDYVESVCNEFRVLYENIKGTTPYCVKRVAVLNCWGRMRAWGNHMVHHAIYHKQNYSYAGIIEALSGAPFDVKFINFDDIRENPDILKDIDVLLNIGDADTAYTGGENWIDEKVVTAVKHFIYEGGGFIGVGEPTAHQWEGRFIQLASVLGIEKENGMTLNRDKYNWEEHEHFITEDVKEEIDFGEGKKSIYALDGTTILCQREKEVQLAVHEFGKGRSVYISGLPYSFENSRLLYRAVIWSASDEENLKRWFSSNYNVEVHAYVANGKYCVVNNTYEEQDTVVYKGDGSSFPLHMEANEIIWYTI